MMPARRTAQSPEPLSWSEWKAQHQQKPWYRRYPLTVEWFFEHVNDRLHRWAFVEFLEHVAKFTVVVAVIVWVLEADDRTKERHDRTKERHYRAWELINSARGSSGDGGRRYALSDLNRDGVRLAAVPLKGAWLWGIDLQGAFLWKADYRGAEILLANLQGAELIHANFQEASLSAANLQRANLTFANLREANLVRTNLQGANLRLAHLEGANLERTDLRGADLRTVKGLTQEQLDSAFGNDATQLPKHLTRPAHWLSSKSEQLIE